MKPPYKICRALYDTSWARAYEMHNYRLRNMAMQFLSSMRYISRRAKK